MSQTAEFADVFEIDIRKRRPIRRNSLHLSLPPGNLALQEALKQIHGKPPEEPTAGKLRMPEKSASSSRPARAGPHPAHCARGEAAKWRSRSGRRLLLRRVLPVKALALRGHRLQPLARREARPVFRREFLGASDEGLRAHSV